MQNCKSSITNADSIKLIYVRPQGTPRYIARSVSVGEVLWRKDIYAKFSPMPELQGKVKHAYIEAYGEEAYMSYNDTEPRMYHGAEFTCIPDDTPTFTHRPDHDMESLFWVLVVVLILAKPLDEPDEITPALSSTWAYFDNHTISKNPYDPRNNIFGLTERAWRELLHPKLSCLAGMLRKLADQVQPEYGLLDPQAKPDHLHEAFRRILLEQILAMDDDHIPLTPNVCRDPHRKKEAEKVKRARDAEPSVSQVETKAKKRKAIYDPNGEAGRIARVRLF